MQNKRCSKCNEIKFIEEFNYKNKAKKIRQAQCRICTREAIKLHYQKNKGYYLKKTKIRNAAIRDQIKNYIIYYLQSHSCVDCGEKDIVVLEFDHLSQKTMIISDMLKKRISLTKIEEEIAKCEVCCANCHRRRSARRGNYYRIVPGISKSENMGL